MTAEEIFKVKQAFIDEQQQLLIKGASDLERKLFNAIMKKFLRDLTTDGGNITDNNRNIKLSNAIDEIFNDFEKNEQVKVANQIISDFNSTVSFNSDYYSLFTSDGTRYEDISKATYEKMKGGLNISNKGVFGQRLESIIQSIRAFMYQRLGIGNKGKIIKDGFIDSFIKDRTLRNDVKGIVLKGVTSGMKYSDLVDSLDLKLTGAGQKDIDGGLTRYYKGFVYDQYQVFDRETNKQFATKLDLKAFVYDGGLIETSRDFCIEKNDKVFTVEEAQTQWPDDPDLPKTKAERDSGMLQGYNPLTDCGRWNCRHLPRYISNELAIRKRPDLKSILE